MSMTPALNQSYFWPMNTPVSIQSSRALNANDLNAEAQTLAETLKAHPGQRWLLIAQEIEQFLLGWLALCFAGKTIILPPNSQPATLNQLAGNIEGWLSDQTLSLNCHGHVLNTRSLWHTVSPEALKNRLDTQNVSSSTLQWHFPYDVAVEMFTSGSTGQPKAIHKRLSHFLREVDTLETTFGSLDGAPIRHVWLAVSHQHIYGILFGLLWPLCTGRSQIRPTLHYGEQLVEQLHLTPETAIIGSPALLRLLAEDSASLSNDRPSIVFSSGGALSANDAATVHKHWGQAPYEIYGSTETGGMAWRQQQPQKSQQPYPPQQGTETAWTPFAGVQWQLDDQQALKVRSPLLNKPDQWWSTGDCARPSGSGFILTGRLDRMIKLAEKRISLDQMEQHLKAHPEVEDAALIVLNKHRQQLGAIIQLTESAAQQWAQSGRKIGIAHLKSHLNQWYEAVTLPRYWRLVEHIPCNPQGKRVHAQLKELFDER
ncbi:hypothetical protein BFW38_13905 [Terasakiispira papahanaumokuakeensis]|uniref:AMP-dependent synthetase/ligase domain-containing protein n=1 Tax=Terasakiispira papahanaumokuakeensis TaxID=197479 RepID=A0A1E2VBY3_9GAMM|nr:class I adenylate-forming enzyme family protein [Terasakiispira papahanaumokuakeensis]ODC04463.1 hypothetical protein BFW38_13905 [Terasakiispira papahanaumokuakeensis]